MASKSKIIQQAIGIIISFALIAWMISAIEWPEVLHAISNMHYWPLLPLTLLLILHFYLRAARWRILLPDTQSPPTLRLLFDAFMAGNFATYILPLRAGEFVRPVLLSRQSSYSFPTAFVSIVVERFFDLATVLLSFAVMLVYIPNIPEVVSKGAMVLGALALCIFVFLVIGVYFPSTLKSLAGFFLSKMPDGLRSKLDKFLDDLLHGLTILKNPRSLALAIWYSILVWGSCYIFYWLFLYCFDLPTSLWAGVAVAVIIALAVAAPSAPGFLGIYEIGCIMGLGLYGVSKESAMAYALVTHAYQYVIIIAYGAYLLTRYHLKIGEMQN